MTNKSNHKPGNSALRDALAQAGVQTPAQTQPRQTRSPMNSNSSDRQRTSKKSQQSEVQTAQTDGRRLIHRGNFFNTSPFYFFSSGRLPQALNGTTMFLPLGQAINAVHQNLSVRNNHAQSFNSKFSLFTVQNLVTKDFGTFKSWENFLWYLVVGDERVRTMDVRSIFSFARNLFAPRTGIDASTFYALAADQLWHYAQANPQVANDLAECTEPLDMYVERKDKASGNQVLVRVGGTLWWVALIEILRESLKQDRPYMATWQIFPNSSNWRLNYSGGRNQAATAQDIAEYQSYIDEQKFKFLDYLQTMKSEVVVVSEAPVQHKKNTAVVQDAPQGHQNAPGEVLAVASTQEPASVEQSIVDRSVAPVQELTASQRLLQGMSPCAEPAAVETAEQELVEEEVQELGSNTKLARGMSSTIMMVDEAAIQLEKVVFQELVTHRTPASQSVLQGHDAATASMDVVKQYPDDSADAAPCSTEFL